MLAQRLSVIGPHTCIHGRRNAQHRNQHYECARPSNHLPAYIGVKPVVRQLAPLLPYELILSLDPKQVWIRHELLSIPEQCWSEVKQILVRPNFWLGLKVLRYIPQ
jgi:hypothetical protein